MLQIQSLTWLFVENCWNNYETCCGKLPYFRPIVPAPNRDFGCVSFVVPTTLASRSAWWEFRLTFLSYPRRVLPHFFARDSLLFSVLNWKEDVFRTMSIVKSGSVESFLSKKYRCCSHCNNWSHFSWSSDANPVHNWRIRDAYVSAESNIQRDNPVRFHQFSTLQFKYWTKKYKFFALRWGRSLKHFFWWAVCFGVPCQKNYHIFWNERIRGG